MDTIKTGDCVKLMRQMKSDTVDLTVTSPPYDDLRTYKGYKFDFESVAAGLYRVTKPGGVVVWVVGDKIHKGSRSLTSFRQALYFQEIGFRAHDVMIYQKKNTPFMRSNAYTSCYELMLVMSKGKPNTFNPLTEPVVRSGRTEQVVMSRRPDGSSKKRTITYDTDKHRTNIWKYAVGLGGTTNDRFAFKHPAMFPEKLAADHIASWSNPGDLVLDPFCGSGTTCKMAKALGRRYLGFDVSAEYVRLAEQRVASVPTRL